MTDLPSLASSLQSSRKLTPAQIRNRIGFLDSIYQPFIALETIQGWKAENSASLQKARRKPVLMAAMPPPESRRFLDTAGRDMVAQDLRRQADESRVLQNKVAQLEAQLRRQSVEFARRTPVPPTRHRLSLNGDPALHHRSWSSRTATVK